MVGMAVTLGKPCPPRHELDALIKDAMAKFDALSPEQKREHRRSQRKSWVIGEMLLEHPEMTREYAEKIYEGLPP
jgi:hypothetical protein